MTPADALSVLRSTRELNGLPDQALQELAPHAYLKHCQDGQLLVARGAPAEGLFVVISGQIRCSTFSEDGREIITALAKPGAFWGILAVLDGDDGAAQDTWANGPTELLVVPTRDFLDMLDRTPALYKTICKLLTYRLRRSYTVLDEMGLASLRQRIARQICTFAGVAPESLKPDTTLRLTQEKLAAMVNATRSSVNREMIDMQREGLVQLGYGTIVIQDPARLLEICATPRIYSF
jgi:CRP-like cAMP-binding protein